MIQLEFENLDSLWQVIGDKVIGIEEIISSRTKTQVAKAVFTITSKRIIVDFSKRANISPQKYSHMFEWESNGEPEKKLFVIRRERVANGLMTINIKYKKSSKFVPIPPQLLQPGATGKSVRSRNVFANKAEVMESGKPVSFTTKGYIAFLSKDSGKINFLPPRTFVTIANPGGKKAAGSFEAFVETWYATKVDTVVRQSGLFQNIGRAVAKTMNDSKVSAPAVRETIRIVTEKYAQGVVEL
jgi:hypothetical protein